MPRSDDYFLSRLAALETAIRTRVRHALKTRSAEDLSTASELGEGDTLFAIDLDAESTLDDLFAEWGEELPLLAVAEGFPGDGGRTYPEGVARDRVAFTCIVDPIDGTRGLMYGKRSAWVLGAIAPAPVDGRMPLLADIRIAMQTELPTPRSSLSDCLWTTSGDGLEAETHNLDTGSVARFSPRPSRAGSLTYGFGTVVKFFPGGKTIASEIEERLAETLLGSDPTGNPRLFDDEYISSGGQLYELLVGHDRFVADLRPLIHAHLGKPGPAAHPYDLCTELIARSCGVEVTTPRGGPLRTSLDIRESCAWVGYANRELRASVEPALHRILRDLDLTPST